VMASDTYNVLFLCKFNSARSIMAESLLTHWGAGRFKAFSAGSEPAGQVRAEVLDLLRVFKMPINGLESKSWDQFAAADAPKMQFIFTVCDIVQAGNVPEWPGDPQIAFWPVPDPMAVVGGEVEKNLALREAFRVLETRIKIFSALRFDALNKRAIDRELDRIGHA
jgi:arsenate reductase